MEPSLVGRERLLGELYELLAAARDGSGALVLLTGEAGIGKSAVADRLAAQARAAGLPVLLGRAVADEGAPAYWPWRRALDSPVAGLSPRLIDPDAHAGSAIDPPAAVRFRIAARTTGALLAAAEPNGMLVVLEDLQWADAASLGVLRHLCGELAGSRLLVVGTVRRSDPDGAEPPELTDLATAHTYRLTALTAADIERYVGTLAAAADDSWPAQLHRLSGGNPLLLRELVRLITADGRFTGPAAQLALPAELRRVVGQRTARLSAPCRRLLAAASVLGEDVDVALLAAVLADGAPQPPGIDDLVSEATGAGVLIDDPDAPDRLRFSHELLRRSCYDDLPRAERVGWHRRIADAWPTRYGDGRVGELAWHRIRAAVEPSERQAAVAACTAAARAAADQLAFGDATRWYDRAVALIDAAPDAPEQRGRLELAAAEAAYHDGQVLTALDRCAKVAALAERLGSAELASRAALTVRGVGGHADEPIAALCTAARRMLGDEDSARHAQVLAQHAFVLADVGQLATARPLSARSMAMAERSGDPDALLGALHARHEVNLGPDGVAERLAVGARMGELARSGGRPDAALWAHVWRIDAMLELGSVAAFDSELFELAGLADRLGWPMVRWHLLRTRCAKAFLQGDYAQAAAHAVTARDLAATMQDGVAQHLFFAVMVPVMCRTGRHDEFSDTVLALLGQIGGEPIAAAQFGMYFAATEDRLRAAQMFEGLVPALAGLPMNSRWLPVLALTGELAVYLGDRDTAAWCYQRLLPYAGHYLNTTTGWYGSVARFLGVLAAGFGDLDAAEQHLGAAVTMETRIGAAADAAVARLDHARALVQRGGADDRARAVELARAAQRGAQRFGMAPTANRAAELVETLTGGRPDSPLTVREQEIAVLVAEGLSNRAIATKLFLSERTVETHVRHMLTKLELANRTQVAGWALRAGLR